MKLYDQGKLDLDKTLGDYLPWVRGSDKQDLVIREILLHQARLKSYIPFYREIIDTISGLPFGGWFSKSSLNNIPEGGRQHVYAIQLA
jgi:CubicO group peptidase (beta-lactamase class C family)